MDPRRASSAQRILVVDDDPSVQAALEKALRRRGYQVEIASSAEEALARMEKTSFSLILLDVNLPGISGIDAIPRIQQIDPEAILIVITAYDIRQTALDAIRSGAYDYFAKPFNLKELEIIVKRGLERRSLLTEVRRLRERLVGMATERLVGESRVIRQVKEMVGRIAPLETTVLITGESGTGKELIADLIHRLSPRASGPLIKVNCAAIPDSLLESELFGHEKGAFTGAHATRPGKFEMASHGTILLDEIGEMPIDLQAKLLRVVEHKEVDRLGGRRPVSVDIRILASTNRDLLHHVRQGRFREDLFYRLNVIHIHIPPLRERKEDIPILAEHLLSEIGSKLGLPPLSLSPEAMKALLDHDWPGNVRELANVLERAAILGGGPVLGLPAIFAALQKGHRICPKMEEGPLSLRQTLQEVEKTLIIEALKRSQGVQTEAAKRLGLTPKNLWKKIQKHRIDVHALMEDDQTPSRPS